MQRDIKFRGLRIDGKGWVYGMYVIRHTAMHYIYVDNGTHSVEVMSESVGQFTGLKDKNGVDIYEWDLIIGNTSYERSDDERIWTVDDPCEVQYWKDDCGFYPFTLNARWRCDVENIEVIGNIHEKK